MALVYLHLNDYHMNLSFWIVRSGQTARLFEPCHEKTSFMHMQKQRCRSALLWLSHLITSQGLVYIAALGRFITKCRMVYIAALGRLITKHRLVYIAALGRLIT